MASNLTELTEIERDAISEIANMGVSRAAASLRQMVGEQVLLSVPTVRIVSREEAAGLVERGNPPSSSPCSSPSRDLSPAGPC